MAFEIHLKDDIGNQLASAVNLEVPKMFTAPSLDIQQGFLVRGNYRIPISHILFIKEV